MSDLVKIQVLHGENVLGVCEFGPDVTKSVLRDVKEGRIDLACRCICGVAFREDGRFKSPYELVEEEKL